MKLASQLVGLFRGNLQYQPQFFGEEHLQRRKVGTSGMNIQVDAAIPGKSHLQDCRDQAAVTSVMSGQYFTCR